MKIENIVKAINSGSSLQDVAAKLNVSRSSVCRLIRSEGYSYNRSLKIYVKRGYQLTDKKARSYSISMDAEKKLKMYAIQNGKNYSEAIEDLINLHCS